MYSNKNAPVMCQKSQINQGVFKIQAISDSAWPTFLTHPVECIRHHQKIGLLPACILVKHNCNLRRCDSALDNSCIAGGRLFMLTPEAATPLLISIGATQNAGGSGKCRSRLQGWKM